MTTEPSQEYVRQHLQLADEALSDARYLLQDNRLKAAANRAYYAMLYAVRAALASAQVKSPKTHGGALNLFGKHFIIAGRMDMRFAKHLHEAYDLRQQSDYEAYAHVGPDEVREVVENAEAFVAEVKQVLGV